MLDLDERKWEEFKNINMEAFFLQTMPEIYIEQCMFDSLDCRHIWQLRKTKLGNCIQVRSCKIVYPLKISNTKNKLYTQSLNKDVYVIIF